MCGAICPVGSLDKRGEEEEGRGSWGDIYPYPPPSCWPVTNLGKRQRGAISI